METYAICFDISNDRNRNRVGKRLLNFGNRVQRSVFEVAVDNRKELERIREQLLDMMEEGDSIRFYRLCAACRSVSLTQDDGPVAYFPAVIIL